MSERRQRSVTYQHVFEHGIVVEDDRDHAQIAQRALGATQNVLALQPQLTRSIQAAIIDTVIVSFC